MDALQYFLSESHYWTSSKVNKLTVYLENHSYNNFSSICADIQDIDQSRIYIRFFKRNNISIDAFVEFCSVVKPLASQEEDDFSAPNQIEESETRYTTIGKKSTNNLNESQQHDLITELKQLQIKYLKLEGEILCVMCKESPRNCVFFPCKHMILCESCAKIIAKKNNLCPTCRTNISSQSVVNY
eukprot:322453_1